MELPELTTQERDYRMYEAKKAGYNYREIAKAFSVSTSTAHAGVKRAGQKEALRQSEDVTMMPWIINEQYDRLIRDITPFTKSQKVHDPETGKEVDVPPSWEAVDRYLKIINEKKKMFGFDQDIIQLDLVGGANAPVVDDGTGGGEINPEEFAKQMVADLIKTKALGGQHGDFIKDLLGDNIIDAEIVEDSEDETKAEANVGAMLPSITEPKILDALPEWVDEDEEEGSPGDWVPNELTDASDFDSD